MITVYSYDAVAISRSSSPYETIAIFDESLFKTLL